MYLPGLRSCSPDGPGALVLFTAALLALVALTGVARADARLCDAAAATAAQETGVPLPVLLAITRTETGRARNGRLEPWPWTVNMEGTGAWFDSPAAALAHVAQHRDRGARSFDIGCFQINHRWHGDAFASVDEMFEPLANARYAAAFLSDLFDETGNWSLAAGAYHSRTPEHATRYTARFDDILLALAEAPIDLTPRTARTPRQNRFPLLAGEGRPARLGSLMPEGGGAGPLVSLDPRGSL